MKLTAVFVMALLIYGTESSAAGLGDSISSRFKSSKESSCLPNLKGIVSQPPVSSKSGNFGGQEPHSSNAHLAMSVIFFSLKDTNLRRKVLDQRVSIVRGTQSYGSLKCISGLSGNPIKLFPDCQYFNSKSAFGIVVHEICHEIDKAMQGRSNRAPDTCKVTGYASFQNKGPVTEAFAESCAAALLMPEKLEQKGGACKEALTYFHSEVFDVDPNGICGEGAAQRIVEKSQGGPGGETSRRAPARAR